jgi:hypothetical protein
MVERNVVDKRVHNFMRNGWSWTYTVQHIPTEDDEVIWIPVEDTRTPEDRGIYNMLRSNSKDDHSLALACLEDRRYHFDRYTCDKTVELLESAIPYYQRIDIRADVPVKDPWPWMIAYPWEPGDKSEKGGNMVNSIWTIAILRLKERLKLAWPDDGGGGSGGRERHTTQINTALSTGMYKYENGMWIKRLIWNTESMKVISSYLPLKAHSTS